MAFGHANAQYSTLFVSLDCLGVSREPYWSWGTCSHQTSISITKYNENFWGYYSDKLSWKPHLLKAINSCRPEVPETKDESRSKNFDLGRVSHLWFGFGKFLLKIANFSIFCPFGSKNISSGRIKARMASFLMWVKSMLGTKRNIDNTHLFVCLFVRPAITIVLFSTSFLSLRSLKTFMLPLCFPLE